MPTLRSLTIPLMIETSSRWLGPLKPQLLAVREAAVLVPNLEAVHAGLIAVPVPAASDGRARAIIAEQRAVDLRHDRNVRSLWHLVQASLEYLQAQDPVDAARFAALERLREALYGNKLTATKLSYLAQAGNAKRVEGLVASDSEVSGLLEEMHLTDQVTGAALVAEWIAHGATLGRLEDEKAQLAAAAAEGASANSLALLARNRWLAVVSTLLDLIGIADVAEEVKMELYRPVEEALAKCAAPKKTAPEGDEAAVSS